ncbi:MAG: prepilin-type N-terminal cleavage/methylation domain-containing protein [Gemmataceae bacterium]
MKTPRKGVTLIEALMAIFVTAIGLLSLLVLFPVGAFRMAQAITDDRAGNLASDAFAIMEALNLHNDPLVVGTAPQNAFTNPDGLQGAFAPPPAGKRWDLAAFAALNATGYDGPSYPVFVDPTAFPAGNGPLLGQLTPGVGISRQTVSLGTTGPLARYWFSLPDDLTFSNDGPYAGLANDPNKSPALQPTRDGTYTASYMLRRPRFQIPSVIDTAVVVYKNRPGSGGGEDAFYVTFDVNNPEVSITYTGAGPSIRKGSWVFDATVLNTQNNQPELHGYFYRVVNVTDNNSGTMVIELQNNPKQSTPGNYGVLVVMENVVEVFEKGPGWKP